MNYLIQPFAGIIVIVDILILVYLFLFVLSLKTKNEALKSFFNFISGNFLSFGFLVSLSATLGSIFLSEVAKYPPCELCWIQRVFMFPQAVILGIGMVKNDISARLYSVVLSTIGLLIAAYHILVQNGQLLSPCSNQSVNCSVKQFVYFGYVTIPVMSATAFAVLILLALPAFKRK
ncbi:MAG: disulfide bond formation protein B [Candidatus Levybacteria bacterium CG_4_9_14_3_um_filter_36_7]|nr:MAG: disulfide bond formation protein B [Candidatus Levybacteria bacterium CG_4_9_14_3_um_filter_36_7]